MNSDIMLARRAIESLRSGVPNKDVVEQLGTTQRQILGAFEDSLESIVETRGAEPLLISATFGAGKTHLLSYLRSVAERQGYVTSYVVISPEMPLGNAHLVLKAIADSARVPGRTGRALRSLSAELSVRLTVQSGLSNWLETANIDDRFRALIRLYEAFKADEDFRLQILGDFEGRAILKSMIKNRLHQIGEASAFDLGTQLSALLAHDRIRLLAQLYKTCGCKGWVILFDEMERVAKFSLKQRLAAYAQLGWWKRIARTAGSAIYPIFTTASGFVAETVTGGSFDEQRLSPASSRDDTESLAADGIELLKHPFRLDLPSPEEEEEIKYRLRSVYERAYGPVSKDSSFENNDVRISLRSEIRRWITLWDLNRHYPNYIPRLSVDEVQFDIESISDNQIFEDEDPLQQ